ncbi:transglycosylase SLT domain-containing protein [Stigmatella sp. ncwal1]|uniref:Transglycosylase SLT domain-containing protein n=1 Tax=Stigmatella ashevillensis TaxID=2995309 RepID=A0ABT5D8R9_9BACT|nr:transglycosylase SLT domain-containing protein [Stigmatella ashevillena]MDC0708677.1 transglycosylase SLT domain-containing protein [Stigmatella ashevillena]
MSLSPLSRNASTISPSNDQSLIRSSSLAQTAQTAGCARGNALPQGMKALQQDSFQAGPELGGEWAKFMESAASLVDAVTQLQSLLQSPELGGELSAEGAEGAQAMPSPFEDSFAPEAPAGQAAASTPSAPSAAGATGSSDTSAASGEAKLGSGLPPALNQYKGAIESAASKAGVPASMLAGQIWQESRGNLGASSTNGGNGLTDTGLMQINPNTFAELQSKHPELQGKNLADPETNILAGAFYMKDMKEQFGSWDLALRAYNSGPNGVDRSNPNAIPAGTGDATYVQKVQKFSEIIATGNGTLPA